MMRNKTHGGDVKKLRADIAELQEKYNHALDDVIRKEAVIAELLSKVDELEEKLKFHKMY